MAAMLTLLDASLRHPDVARAMDGGRGAAALIVVWDRLWLVHVPNTFGPDEPRHAGPGGFSEQHR
jgi:hypothetical protein